MVPVLENAGPDLAAVDPAAWQQLPEVCGDWAVAALLLGQSVAEWGPGFGLEVEPDQSAPVEGAGQQRRESSVSCQGGRGVSRLLAAPLAVGVLVLQREEERRVQQEEERRERRESQYCGSRRVGTRGGPPWQGPEAAAGSPLQEDKRQRH